MSRKSEGIEGKWQKIWRERKVFEVDINPKKKKCYVLEMFPYPSGKLHVGHVRNYVIGDVIARYKRLCGFNVLHPIGWDAFGLPAENAAIDQGVSPSVWTEQNIASMRHELSLLGISYDWSREIKTCSSSYYLHEQKLFLKMLQKDLAYRQESWINWDPVDKTVLANEQVVDGRGWRSGAVVEKKKLHQWFFRITRYANDLIESLNNLHKWPEKVRIMQKNWIGRAKGVEIKFEVHGISEIIDVFTTRPDTIFGCSFIAIGCDHYLVKRYLDTPNVKAFVNKCMALKNEEIDKTKLGLFTGLYGVHPFCAEKKIPIYIANFILSDYASGAVYGCPAHDERDYEFAVKYDLEIVRVIESNSSKLPHIESGTMINSKFLNGMDNELAKSVVTERLIKEKLGKERVVYRLRDWGISRQRFWGCPIPIIHCNDCGIVPVPLEQLPVTLPDQVTIAKGNFLESCAEWVNTACPLCKKSAKRETDTFDTFFESSWYFLKFCSKDSKTLINEKDCNYWMPVDHYIGGVEHAVLHLLYARFISRVMIDCGYTSVPEPFDHLLNQGMVLHHTFKDSDGNFIYPEDVVMQEGGRKSKSSGKVVYKSDGLEKMSKSKKNVIGLDYIVKQYGADTLRLYVLSDTPPEKDVQWVTEGVEGCSKFISKLFSLAEVFVKQDCVHARPDESLLILCNGIVKNVSYAIEQSKFNNAIAYLRTLCNEISDRVNTNFTSTTKECFVTLIKMFNPFIPHVTEEIWNMLGHDDILALDDVWPKVNIDSALINSKVKIAVQINGKTKGIITVPLNADQECVKTEVRNDEKLKSWLIYKEAKKTIFVPNKIINFVL
ncbi:leucine--tRNA ligase [Candidatus Sneabacter namystus]|uniref:Leucine--tRNA ligase n=1 Tax=Candidatus Sneabacter namystus TaxID=2601646 RepID=A0A5C0UJR2_9RICK|nr:leucine--tRNA ligase [Candidatus Sneabacter namystus]QEK39763.1 leucine--tRNA ligase [Candidatus Sneabacter namystus]